MRGKRTEGWKNHKTDSQNKFFSFFSCTAEGGVVDKYANSNILLSGSTVICAYEEVVCEI